MAIKLIDKATQKEIAVSSDEAQAGLQRGDYVLPSGDVRVVQGNRTSTVAAGELADAIGHGWKLADDEEVAAATLRREESDLSSKALGGLEATLAGATLGGSTYLEDALGVDPERMRARREGLGGLGSALELGGALVPGLLTGGTATAAGAARGLGARALAATPAGALARTGARLEAGLGRSLARAPALVRTTVPVVGRGTVEGFAAGVGAEIDESVLGERDLTAERLLGAGAYGSLFGAGASALIPGIAAVGQGIGKVGIRPIRQVLGKAGGMVDELGDKGLASILANPGAREKFAALNHLDIADVNLIADELVSNPTAINRYLTEASAVTEDLAADLRPAIESLRAARRVAIAEGSGAGRLRDVGRHLPSGTDDLARIPDLAKAQLDNIEAGIRKELDVVARARELDSNVLPHVDVNDLRQVLAEINEARIAMSASARSANNRGGARQVAAASVTALDDLKRGIDRLRVQGRGLAPTRASQNTSEILDRHAGALRTHLEDATIHGQAGVRHATRNRLMSAAIAAEKRTRGTASGRLLARDSIVDNADLLSTVRNSGRFAGATKTELFEDAVQAEAEYIEWALRNLDLDKTEGALPSLPDFGTRDVSGTGGLREQLVEQLDALRSIPRVFEGQRAKVRTLDVLEKWRNAEGNRSVSIGIGSGLAPALLGAAGFGVGGIPGAIVGGALGMLTKPYTMTRKLAAIQARIGKAQGARQKAIADFIVGAGKTAVAAVGAAARATGRAATRGTVLAAGASSGRREQLDTATKRLSLLASNPAELAAEIRRMTQDLDDVAPLLAGAVTKKVTLAATFLASKAPATYKAPWSTRPPLVDPVEEAKFEKYLEAVSRPMDAIARLSHGTFTREHAEAIRVVYPAEYMDLQREAIERLAKMQERGESPSLSTMTTLSILFDTPGDPTLPQATAIAASLTPSAAEQAREQGLPAPTKPTKVDIDTDRYSSPTAGIGQMT